MPNKQLTKRDFVQLEHRGMKCTFVRASERPSVRNVPVPRDCFLHRVLAVTVLSLGHREGATDGFVC